MGNIWIIYGTYMFPVSWVASKSHTILKKYYSGRHRSGHRHWNSRHNHSKAGPTIFLWKMSSKFFFFSCRKRMLLHFRDFYVRDASTTHNSTKSWTLFNICAEFVLSNAPSPRICAATQPEKFQIEFGGCGRHASTTHKSTNSRTCSNNLC